jgi:HAD superfamily hydrolase (TIGR01509 family)
MGTKKHFIFDLDGTLLDTEHALCVVTAELATAKGRPLTTKDVLRDFSGIGTRDKFAAIGEAQGKPFTDAELDALASQHEERKSELYRNDPPINPHVPEMLAGLVKAGHLASLGSSNTTSYIHLALKTSRLTGHFNDRVYGFDLAGGREKPDPAIFLLAMKENGSTAEDTVVVEDSIAGVRAGRAANAFVVAYLDPRTGARGGAVAAKEKALKEAGADVVIRDFRHLARHIPRA